MKVRLTKKLADTLDGIDLSRYHVGDAVEIPDDQARLLIAEDWGAPERRRRGDVVVNGRRAEDPHLVNPRTTPNMSRAEYRHSLRDQDSRAYPSPAEPSSQSAAD